MRQFSLSSDSSFKCENFDVSQSYFAYNLVRCSVELTKFLNSPYHHQEFWWGYYLLHLIRLLKIKILMYHKGILFKIWVVSLLSCKSPLCSVSSSRVLMKIVIDSSYPSFENKDLMVWPSYIGWRILLLDQIRTFGATANPISSTITILRVCDQTKNPRGALKSDHKANASA